MRVLQFKMFCMKNYSVIVAHFGMKRRISRRSDQRSPKSGGRYQACPSVRRRSDERERRLRSFVATADGVALPPFDLSATKDIVLGRDLHTYGIFSAELNRVN